MAFEAESIVTLCTSDLAGQVRGKGFPARDLEKRRKFGVGWTPTNSMINCFGSIQATPWGALGDLMLTPDPEGDVRLDYDDAPGEHFILGDIKTLDGQPWSCCPRSFLRRALADLKAETGLNLLAAFEHEFHYDAADDRVGDSYSVGSLRGVEDFINELIGALRANGIQPDTFLPEYGPRQFEVTIDPADGLAAADHAVKLREITRALGRRHGGHVSFSPVVTRGAAGNGVHIHFSFTDDQGKPVTHDPDGPGGLSRQAASFSAGLLRHARALCAVVTPSVMSYERLKPHSWSAYWTNLGLRDREATLRICPVPEDPSVDVAKRYNLEYRAADAAASPYLQLGMLVYAGLAGIREDLPAPVIGQEDPETLSAEERAKRGITTLPQSLEEALQALEADKAALSWLGPELAEAYIMHKRGEIGMLKGKSTDEICQLYTEVY